MLETEKKSDCLQEFTASEFIIDKRLANIEKGLDGERIQTLRDGASLRNNKTTSKTQSTKWIFK